MNHLNIFTFLEWDIKMKLFNAVLLAGAAQAGVGSRVIDMVRSNRYDSVWITLVEFYFRWLENIVIEIGKTG